MLVCRRDTQLGPQREFAQSEGGYKAYRRDISPLERQGRRTISSSCWLYWRWRALKRRVNEGDNRQKAADGDEGRQRWGQSIRMDLAVVEGGGQQRLATGDKVGDVAITGRRHRTLGRFKVGPAG